MGVVTIVYEDSGWQRLLPLVSAVIVTLLGAAIALKGLTVYIA